MKITRKKRIYSHKQERPELNYQRSFPWYLGIWLKMNSSNWIHTWIRVKIELRIKNKIRKWTAHIDLRSKSWCTIWPLLKLLIGKGSWSVCMLYWLLPLCLSQFVCTYLSLFIIFLSIYLSEMHFDRLLILKRLMLILSG